MDFDFGFDDIIDSFLDIPDTLMDLPDIVGEFFSSMFESITEFSITGLVFGLISFGTVLVLNKYLLEPFLSYMGGIERIIWMIITYVGCFISGYLLGNYFENS